MNDTPGATPSPRTRYSSAVPAGDHPAGLGQTDGHGVVRVTSDCRRKPGTLADTAEQEHLVVIDRPNAMQGISTGMVSTRWPVATVPKPPVTVLENGTIAHRSRADNDGTFSTNALSGSTLEPVNRNNRMNVATAITPARTAGARTSEVQGVDAVGRNPVTRAVIPSGSSAARSA